MKKLTRKSIELKNVKVYVGMSQETTAFTASLYIDGKKAADVRNEGRGGDNWPSFADRDLRDRFYAFCESLPPEQFEDTTSINEDGLTKCCEALTTFEALGHDSEECCKVCFKEIMEPYPVTYDSFIGDLLTEWIENDAWKKACRKGLVFLLKDGPPGAYRITNGKYSAILAEKIRERHGDNLLEIVNERFQ